MNTTNLHAHRNIEVLALSTRSYLNLRRHGINAVGEIPDELAGLLTIRGMGVRSIEEIREALADIDTRVRFWDSPETPRVPVGEKRMAEYLSIRKARLDNLRDLLSTGRTRKEIAQQWGLPYVLVCRLIRELRRSQGAVPSR